MVSNRLKMNVPKTELMAVSPTVGRPEPIQIVSSNVVVKSTDKMKVLGIFFQSNLKFDHHVKLLLANIAYKTTILRVIKPMANFNTMKLLATSLIMGKILYALPLWCNLPLYLQTRIQTSLLTAARRLPGGRAC